MTTDPATRAPTPPPCSADAGVPFGTQLQHMAEMIGDEVGVVLVPEHGDEQRLTWGELDEQATALAHVLVEDGVGVGDYVAVCLRSSLEHLVACFAGWKAGAAVVPMRWDLPPWERDRLIGVLRPAVVVDAGSGELFERARRAPTTPMAEVTPVHGWGVCSSGSTGAPKVIVQKAPALFFPALSQTSAVVESYGALERPQRVLQPAPLYHSNGFTTFRHLMAGTPIVLLERFHAEQVLEVIERHQVTGFIAATPMLQRLARAPRFDRCDLSSLDWVQQGASPLPQWLGRIWTERIGAERFYLSYGASEGVGLVVCRGDEWLAHPGTLGRGFGDTEVAILDASGTRLPPGEVGSIYLRTPSGPLTTYVGDDVAPLEMTADGFVTVGDLGWLDDDGYLYMADRRVDLIVSGAANVFPAEVEAALSEHPGIADVVVVGLRDPEWGRRVHAIVQPADRSLSPEDVITFAKSRLAAYKVPKTVELVEQLPRSEATKLNRAALVAERDGPGPGDAPSASMAPGTGRPR